jgi:mannobiose 2-epimerase
MSRLFPSDKKYYGLFLEQWNQIKKYQIDHEYGGWYERGIDRHSELAKSNKGNQWKSTYHVVRALTNCIKMLEYSSF